MKAAATFAVATLLICKPAAADTLEAALAYAYVNNPQLNSQRAVVRATDEKKPTAPVVIDELYRVTVNAGVTVLVVHRDDQFDHFARQFGRSTSASSGSIPAMARGHSQQNIAQSVFQTELHRSRR